MANKSHDPLKNILIIGTSPILGFDPEQMFKTSTKEDVWSGQTGADGIDFTWIKNRDLQGTITVNIMKNSDSVGIIKGYVDIADLTGIPFPISILDLNTNQAQFAGSCMLTKWPDSDYQKKPGVLEFVFLAASIL